jgi:hypothetical protein
MTPRIQTERNGPGSGGVKGALVSLSLFILLPHVGGLAKIVKERYVRIKRMRPVLR